MITAMSWPRTTSGKAGSRRHRDRLVGQRRPVEHNVLVDNVNAAILVGGNGRHGSEVINDLIEDNNTEGTGSRAATGRG